MRRAFLILMFLPLVAAAQTPAPKDVWLPLKFLVGSWTGTGDGQPGTSEVEREYKFVLNGKFLNVTHRSVYKPQTKNPKGETHEDWGLFSYDRSRKGFVFRQFHVEGFVTQYRLESISDDGKLIVFVSESIENIPAGWRAKETYRIVNADEFIETFELAGPGKEFTIYSENHFKRQK